MSYLNHVNQMGTPAMRGSYMPLDPLARTNQRNSVFEAPPRQAAPPQQPQENTSTNTANTVTLLSALAGVLSALNASAPAAQPVQVAPLETVDTDDDEVDENITENTIINDFEGIENFRDVASLHDNVRSYATPGNIRLLNLAPNAVITSLVRNQNFSDGDIASFAAGLTPDFTEQFGEGASLSSIKPKKIAAVINGMSEPQVKIFLENASPEFLQAAYTQLTPGQQASLTRAIGNQSPEALDIFNSKITGSTPEA